MKFRYVRAGIDQETYTIATTKASAPVEIIRRFKCLFLTGTNTHVLDYKRSAGGFIHGFRYSGRTLHRIFENRFHNISWPHVKFDSAIDVIPHLIKRVSEASDIYQMFGVMCEIMIFSEDNTKATYLPVRFS